MEGVRKSLPWLAKRRCRATRRKSPAAPTRTARWTSQRSWPIPRNWEQTGPTSHMHVAVKRVVPSQALLPTCSHWLEVLWRLWPWVTTSPQARMGGHQPPSGTRIQRHRDPQIHHLLPPYLDPRLPSGEMRGHSLSYQLRTVLPTTIRLELVPSPRPRAVSRAPAPANSRQFKMPRQGQSQTLGSRFLPSETTWGRRRCLPHLFSNLLLLYLAPV